jgi:hypothetical protein
VGYLRLRAEEKIGAPDIYLDASDAVELKTLREADAAAGATEIEVSKRLYIGKIPLGATADECALLLTAPDSPSRRLSFRRERLRTRSEALPLWEEIWPGAAMDLVSCLR